MYPTLLRDQVYPTHLVAMEHGTKPDDLMALAKDFGVIARVRIETETPEFPYRREGKTQYPVGRFTTTLAGPDILALADCGRIVNVGDVALYRLGTPFKAAMTALIDERMRALAARDGDAEQFAKLLANSLAGKLAQRMGCWKRREEMDDVGRWGVYTIKSTRTGKTTRLRYLAGLCSEYVEDESGAGPHTAAFAYLTAYGRQHMARLRSLLPKHTVVSQDTDGLWILPDGTRAILETPGLVGEAPGQLRIVDSANTARFYGPRHYCVDGHWVLSGFHQPQVDDSSGLVSWTCRTPLWEVKARYAPSEIVTHIESGPIPCDETGDAVGDDGWTIPRRYLSRWREDDAPKGHV